MPPMDGGRGRKASVEAARHLLGDLFKRVILRIFTGSVAALPLPGKRNREVRLPYPARNQLVTPMAAALRLIADAA